MGDYTAGWNMPGYLPDTDPGEFESFLDAAQYIDTQLGEVIDCEPLQDGGTPTERAALDARATLREATAPFKSSPVGGYVYWIEQRT